MERKIMLLRRVLLADQFGSSSQYDDVQLHHGTCSSQSPAFVHILLARR